jgi:hypothetical protein
MISFREFNFKKSVKLGNLEKGDKVHFDKLTKLGWNIDAFNVTSKGYEITIQHKNKRGRAKFVGKNPSDAIKIAANKAT